jgi:hypothetical protein
MLAPLYIQSGGTHPLGIIRQQTDGGITPATQQPANVVAGMAMVDVKPIAWPVGRTGTDGANVALSGTHRHELGHGHAVGATHRIITLPTSMFGVGQPLAVVLVVLVASTLRVRRSPPE